MRWFATLVLALALGVMGCSETTDPNGTGGDGGAAGTGGGGVGGDGGADLCEAVVCDAACKLDGVCDPQDGICDYARTLEDGTACGQGPGACQEGVCVGGVFSCDFEGIQEAIKTGGGPHTFDCDGPTTIEADGNEFLVYESVILDGEGNITLLGSVFIVSDPLCCRSPVPADRSKVEAEIVGFSLDGDVYVIDHNSLALRDCSGYNSRDERCGFHMRASGDVTVNNCAIDGGLEPPWCASTLGFEGRYSVMLTNTTINGSIATGDSRTADASSYLTLVDSAASHVSSRVGTLTLVRSTVSGGSGISGGGTLIAIDSAVTDNDVPGGDGAGGIYWFGALSLANTTVSGNVGQDCTLALQPCGHKTGGLFFQYHDQAPKFAVIHNSTISNNAPDDIDARSPLEIGGSIVGACRGPVTSLGYNIESPGDTCGFDPDKGDQVNVPADDLKLGELAENGGPTMTHALGAGSVAIDQIPAVDCVDADGEPLTTDQRGEPRPVAIVRPEPTCDVGAFERQPDDE